MDRPHGTRVQDRRLFRHRCIPARRRRRGRGRAADDAWEDIADLRKAWPERTVIDAVRWVEHGQLISSAGIAAGIDMSLHLVERLAGRALADRTARQMDVRWLDTP